MSQKNPSIYSFQISLQLVAAPNNPNFSVDFLMRQKDILSLTQKV